MDVFWKSFYEDDIHPEISAPSQTPADHFL